MPPLQLLIADLGGWLHREQADIIAFLRLESGLLKAKLAGRRLRFDDGERPRLAELGYVSVAGFGLGTVGAVDHAQDR